MRKKLFLTGMSALLATGIVNRAHGSLVIDNFESGNVDSWGGSGHSGFTIDTTTPDTGTYAGQWVFTYNGVDAFDNEIHRSFPTPLDLTSASAITLRFDNPADTTINGQIIFWSLSNNGIRQGGDAGSGTFNVPAAGTGYQNINLDLGTYNRNSVDSLTFYVYGPQYTQGGHVWFLDNITANTSVPEPVAIMPAMVIAFGFMKRRRSAR